MDFSHATHAPRTGTRDSAVVDVVHNAKTAPSPWLDPQNQLVQHAKPTSGAAVSQVTLMPATQTTVVTTTTTTTLTLPPFTLKAPRDLRFRDPETYPLAASPTPAHIKRLKLDFPGYSTHLEEVDDPEEHTQQYRKQQHVLKAHDGVLRSVVGPTSPHTTRPASRPSDSALKPAARAGLRLRDRSATPVSLSDAAEMESFHRRNGATTSATKSTILRRRHPLQNRLSLATQSSDEDDEYDSEAFLSKITRTSVMRNHSTGRRADADQRGGSNGGLQSPAEIDEVGAAADTASTSSFAESDVDFRASTNPCNRPRRVPLPSNLDTASLQDASLPSPRLSPVTAAARDHQARAFSPADEYASDYLDARELPESIGTSSATEPQGSQPSMDIFNTVDQATLEDVPKLIESFDHLPDNLKTYTIFQLLRRCNRSTIHFVAEAIDPALRCDFLGRLPLELSFQILDHLDAQSMCRAAQVSRKWRSIVDADEKAWSELIKRDGFNLPEGELEQAVRGGWGWGYLGSLQDWAQCESPTAHSFAHEFSRESSPGSGFTADDPIVLTASPKRKRKSNSKYGSNKRQKRRPIHTDPFRSEPWMKTFRATSGPNAYAQAAAMAVPDPKNGLPSLRNLHLFKSIYQRHHLIRRSWMDKDALPLHRAFRAHQRHVVTCLQFDSEKILTGSDDANIDIYDTKTGATLQQLTGHDGGVWALEYQGDLLVSGSTDRTVRIWDMKSGHMLHIFSGHTSTVRCLQILKPTKIGETADGKPIMMPKTPLIITGSRDSTCRIWRLPKIGDESVYQWQQPANDADNPFFVRTLSGHHNSVRAIAAHADTLISGSYDSTVRVWKISTGEMIHRLQGHTTKVYSVVLDHDRRRCISGSMDNSVKIWSLETGSCLYNLEGHSSLVGLLDLKDDVLVSAAADATLRVWDPQDGRCRSTLLAHTGAITCFAHDGRKIISGSDRTLKMWNTKTGEWTRDLLDDLSGVWQVRFDQRRCVAAVQRNNWTYIEVLDFAAPRDGVPKSKLGRRIVVDARGREIPLGEEELAADVVEVR